MPLTVAVRLSVARTLPEPVPDKSTVAAFGGQRIKFAASPRPDSLRSSMSAAPLAGA